MGSSIHSARSLSLENVSGTFLKVAKVPEDVFAGICVNCLADKGKNAVCPCCAYDAQTSRHHPLYLRPGTILANQYIIGKVLGQGGFGITYIGLDKWLRKKVAIKEYLPSSLAVRDTAGLTVTSLRNQKDAFAKGLHLFIDEARNLAKFDHPHIVRVINFFEENQTGYMVMEYLKGESPAAFMKKYQGRLPLDQALEILFPIFDALRTIHAKHTCHLDISAQNICIKKEDNVPVLIDFGSAKCIVGGGPHTMTLVLKPGYSPLEQYSGRGNIGPWSDIYACGALLYLMITGKFPPAATERFDTDPLVPPLAVENVKISDMANRAIMKALALKIEDRYQDIAAFQQALTSGISSKEDKPANGLPSRHRTKHKKRHYFLLGTVLLIGLFITPVKEEATSPAKFVMMEPQAAAEKLTSPGEDNGTSRKILESDPADQKARQTLLAEQYAQQAMSEQEQGNLEKSLNLADKGLRIMPAHPQLLQLKAKLDYRLELQKQQEEKRRAVQKLSVMAEKRFQAGELGAARQKYQEMLKLEPGSATAANGLKRLSRQYEQRARASQKAGSLTASLSRVREGLAYFPDHSGLRSLLEELTDPARIQERKANRLLRKAKKQLAALRLTTPAGNNAYESYRRVLALFPNNLEAQVGLKNIADRYLRFARGMPDEPEKARQMIGKGLLVMPDHLELLALKQQRFDKPDKPRNKESNAQAEDVQSERVKRLSHTAARHVAAKEFDAAAEKYKNILALVPNNAPALQGLEQIAGQYEILARAQQRAGKLPESLMMAAKGLGVSPQHPGLSALQKELTSQINANTQSKPSVEPILLTPSF